MSPFDDAHEDRRGHRLPRRRRATGGDADVTRTDLVAGRGASAEDTSPTREAPRRVETTQFEAAAPSTARMPVQEVLATQAQPRGGIEPFVGPFEILEKVGEGGMGVVYRARDTRNTGREVALKVLRPHIAYDPDAQARLAREVDTLERVHHPNVAAVVDADPWGERPYIATEFVPGTPLDKVVNARGPFDPEQMARLGRDLAAAIDAIHSAGVVHRDLKPSNVLMVGDKPVVIDFGIAHVADDARLTSTGLVMGTPGYLSPELVEGAPVSTSTDWWGWAATLAFAGQGEPPFGRGPMTAVLDRVTRGQSNLSGVDERLRPLLAAALSPVPAERPAAREVLDQMERYARGEPTTVVPVRGPSAPATAAMNRPDATRVAPERQSHGRPPQQYVHPRGATPVAPAPQAPAEAQAPRRQEPAAPPLRPVRPQSRPGEHDPRLTLPARTGMLQALFVAWVALTSVLPVLGLVVLILWNLASRFTDSTITQTVLRRYEAGRRRSDGAVAVASAPWHVVRAALGTLVALILPLLVFACVTALVGIGWAAVRGGVPTALWAVPIAPAAAAAALTMWRGPASTTYRRGSRSIARGVAPTSRAASVAATILLAFAVFFALGSLSQHGDISWAPLTRGFVDPLATYLPNTGNPLR